MQRKRHAKRWNKRRWNPHREKHSEFFLLLSKALRRAIQDLRAGNVKRRVISIPDRLEETELKNKEGEK